MKKLITSILILTLLHTASTNYVCTNSNELAGDKDIPRIQRMLPIDDSDIENNDNTHLV